MRLSDQELPDFGTPRLSPELYTGTVFAKWGYEGKEISLVTVFLDPCNHQLRIKPVSSAKQIVIDVRRVQVGSRAYACELHPHVRIICHHNYGSLQLILSGNKPKEVSKLRKVLEPCEEVSTLCGVYEYGVAYKYRGSTSLASPLMCST